MEQSVLNACSELVAVHTGRGSRFPVVIKITNLKYLKSKI